VWEVRKPAIQRFNFVGSKLRRTVSNISGLIVVALYNPTTGDNALQKGSYLALNGITNS
jgi:hypothetical protein